MSASTCDPPVTQGPACFSCARPSDALLDDVWYRGADRGVYPPICARCRAERYPGKGSRPLGSVPPPLDPPPPPPPKTPTRGLGWPYTNLPRCITCRRALRGGRHTCQPLRRSHRYPWTDDLTPSPKETQPTELPALKPFPPEGVEFFCRVASELNLTRWNWQARRARSRGQRAAVHKALAPYEPPALPVEILLTRTGWNHLDEHDNLRLACKSVVDQVAEWLGVDDRDPRIRWMYAQKVTRELETVATSKGPARRSVNRMRIEVRKRVKP